MGVFVEEEDSKREESRRVFLDGLGYDPLRAAHEAREQGLGVSPSRVHRLMDKADPRFNPRLSSFLRDFHGGREEGGYVMNKETLALHEAALLAEAAENENDAPNQSRGI